MAQGAEQLHVMQQPLETKYNAPLLQTKNQQGQRSIKGVTPYNSMTDCILKISHLKWFDWSASVVPASLVFCGFFVSFVTYKLGGFRKQD